jgi:surface polysaccharide O-acyltransferase-like enzyme
MDIKPVSLQGTRITWVDFLRSIGIVLVIMIHAAGPLANKLGVVSMVDWMAGNFYNSFSRVSVPLLFMVSGYLLLGKQESISAFYLKRFKKVLIPFLFWSVFYLIWQNGYKNFTFINAIKAIISAILTTPAFFHLWFLYELLAIYLFVPILRIFIKGAEQVHLWYFAAIWILFGPIQNMVENIAGFRIALNLGFFTSYIGFFVIGYLLGKMEFSNRVAAIAAVIYILAGGYTMYATYSLSSAAGDFVQYYYWYTRINIVLMSFAAFIALKNIGEKISNDGAIKWLGRFANASFGIYLVHALVLTYLKRNGISALSGPSIFTVPSICAAILLISWGIVAIIQRIPILREITP